MQAGERPDPDQLLAEARQGRADRLGVLLELYRNYLHLLARTQIDLHLQGRVNPSDLVQETSGTSGCAPWTGAGTCTRGRTSHDLRLGPGGFFPGVILLPAIRARAPDPRGVYGRARAGRPAGPGGSLGAISRPGRRARGL